MNAKEQAIVTGMQRMSGLMLISTQTIIKIGRKTEAVEVFEVNPVMKEMRREMMKGRSAGLIQSISCAMLSPSIVESPEEVHASARAKPAPSKMITSHASLCWTSFH